MCLVGNKRAEIAARVLLCENNFCTEFAHQLHFCGLQKLKTLILCLFHPPLNPRNHFSTVLIETNWYTMICKYSNCNSLTSIDIPNSVTSIRRNIFADCGSLTSVTIPNSVTSIDVNAFVYCESLKDVTVEWMEPLNISRWDDIFEGCPLENATLHVPIGTADKYRGAVVWKDFGYIKEYDPTGIRQVKDENQSVMNGKYLLNGRIVIKKADKEYTLDGKTVY